MNSSGRTIVVTGGLGHIGSRLIREMEADIQEIRVVDNMLTQRYASLFDLPSKPRVVFYEDDILKADLAPILKGADAVVHLAAITNAEATVGRETETEAVNFDGLRRVAEIAETQGTALIFPSTTSVYGSQSAVVDETCEELKPQSPYAESKLKAEEYLRTRKDLRSVTLRLGTIFGWSPGIRFHTAVNKFIWQAINGMPITVWKTAWDQKRPYLDLGDCVRAINHVLQEKLFDGETYNVVTNNFTVKDIVESIRTFVPSLDVVYVDSRIMNQLSYDVRADKFAAKGFIPHGDLREGIAGTVEKLRGISRT